MRRILFIWLMCAFITAPAWADLISFVDEHPLVGVDGSPLVYDGDPPVDWSIGEDTVNLSQQTYSLLGGMATVSALPNYPGSVPTLSHRLTRGLGVYASELDEVDRVNSIEHIGITFTTPYYVHEIEVRSLFDPDTDNNEEWAAIAFWKEGIVVQTEYLIGTEQLGINDNDGDAKWSGTPIIVDKLVFYVPTIEELDEADMIDIHFNTYDPLLSEFAVSKLTVTITPVPSSVLLGILGLGVTGLKLRRFT